jgi:hypothetical protein
VWLPAIAELLAEVKVNTSVSELEPSFDASTPSKSVSALTAVDSVARSVPMPLNAVSCAFKLVNCVCHGFSIEDESARIELTVVATSKPAPLVAAPKLNPTVPIFPSNDPDSHPSNPCTKDKGQHIRNL